MRLFFVALPLLLTCTLYGQSYLTVDDLNKKALKQYEAVRGYINAGQNAAAIEALDVLLKKEPAFIDGHLMQADLYLRAQTFDKAEQGFETAIQLDSTYAPLGFFLVAQAEFEQQKYGEAQAHLESYFASGKAKGKRIAEARQMLKSAKFAAKAIQTPVPFDPKPLPSSVNTTRPEYLPTITANGDFLVYTTRTTPRNEDIFISQWQDTTWGPGEPLEALNTPFNDSSPSLSADGRAMAFTRNDRSGNFDLYYARQENGAWQDPERLPAPVNTGGFESQPALSADGNLMLFVSDRKEGFGKLDLWATRRNADGSWRNPQNLGEMINTPLNEQAPFFHPDGQTLYFMSKGHPGMGQYDLFIARLKPDGSWERPCNLGYPINTSNNEGALIVSLDGQTAYFDTDQLGPTARTQEMGNADLYSFPLHAEVRPRPATYVEATVRDAETKQPLQAKLEFVRLNAQKTHQQGLTDERGQFLVVLPMGRDYALNVSKEGYLFHSENFALSEATALDEPYQLIIELRRVPETGISVEAPSAPVVLRNVFFASGSSELMQESIPELDRLKAFLEDHPERGIIVNGHTDNIGDEAANLALSEARAKAVRDYLASHGINPIRLGFKGYGESRPIASNETPEGRAQNRRTEFEIVK
ncbi:MAG: PD40 domain-containing protein [Phaeodactylibacter sp.]|nr:PD40 domain-containing protein [Phaeodactylibacter sp.]